MTRIARSLALVTSLAALGCTDQALSPTLAVPAAGHRQLNDGAHAGTPGFYFLSPMAPTPTTQGTFDADLAPSVSICWLHAGVCARSLAEYTRTSGTDAERVQIKLDAYVVNWDTRRYAVAAGDTARVRVSVGSTELGFADVLVVSDAAAAKNVNANQFAAVVNGRSLAIKFRIETGIAAEVTVTPASATVAAGATRQLTATAKDLHGVPLPAAAVTWRSSTPGVTVSQSGMALGLEAGTATITATSGAASATASLTVTTTYWTPTSFGNQGNSGVWGSSSSDVYMANWVGVLHFDGTQWAMVPELQWHGTLDVYGFGANDVWAVGPAGRVLRYDGAAWSAERYDGVSVVAEPLGVWSVPARNVYLRGVWGSAPNDVFVAGDSGTVLHWNGAAWSTMSTGTTVGLRRVWGSSGTDVYVSGDGGTLLHYNGASWSPVAVPATQTLERIWGSSATDVYVGGANATLLHFDGTSWSRVAIPVDPANTVFAVWGTSANNVYIAGSGGFVRRWDGENWLREESGRTEQITGLWGVSGTDVFAAMSGGWVTRR